MGKSASAKPMAHKVALFRADAGALHHLGILRQFAADKGRKLIRGVGLHFKPLFDKRIL
jgi:hypothetical protein